MSKVAKKKSDEEIFGYPELQKKLQEIALRGKNDVVNDYIINLQKQLKEKNSFTFWAFPDIKEFKRITGKSMREIQSLLKKNPDKYINRNIAKISICPCPYVMKPFSNTKYGIYLYVDVTIFKISKEATIANERGISRSSNISWEEDDFKITKLTFKFLQKIMELVNEKKITGYAALSGVKLSKVMDSLANKKINISDVLTPLAGV